MSASLLTIGSLAVSSGLLCCHKLNPWYNLTVNGILSALWIVGLVFLAMRTSETIFRSCSYEWWGSDLSVQVCKLYKVLFAATIFGVYVDPVLK